MVTGQKKERTLARQSALLAVSDELGERRKLTYRRLNISRIERAKSVSRVTVRCDAAHGPKSSS